VIDPPFRSPRERVGGLYYFGRMLDKIRCHLREKLPKEYRPNFGLSIGLDGMLCGMLGVTHADLIERMRQTLTSRKRTLAVVRPTRSHD
jgi:hypothetical protein